MSGPLTKKRRGSFRNRVANPFGSRQRTWKVSPSRWLLGASGAGLLCQVLLFGGRPLSNHPEHDRRHEPKRQDDSENVQPHLHHHVPPPSLFRRFFLDSFRFAFEARPEATQQPHAKTSEKGAAVRKRIIPNSVSAHVRIALPYQRPQAKVPLCRHITFKYHVLRARRQRARSSSSGRATHKRIV